MATTTRPRLGVNHPTVVPTNFDAETPCSERTGLDRDRADEPSGDLRSTVEDSDGN